MNDQHAAAVQTALEQYDILDTERDAAFDDTIQIACSILHTPFGMITLLDTHRQWFLSEVGLGVRETPLEGSFCAVTVNQPGALIIEDTHADPVWADNPFVRGKPGIRFYAGVPLITQQGVRIGALCTFDTKPHAVNAGQLQALQALARQIIALFDLRVRTKEVALKQQDLQAAEQVASTAGKQVRELQDRLTALAEHSTDFIGMYDMQGSPFYGNPAAFAMVGLADLEAFRKIPLLDFFFPEDRAMIEEQFLPRVLAEGRAQREVRFRHFESLEAVWMDYEVFVLKDGEGTNIGLATVSRNITAQRLADAALVESAKLAAVGRLASSIAHEINNPLEAVTNLLYIIGQDTTLSQSTRDFVHTAEREVARASQLTSQTLRFHRQSTAATKVRPRFMLAEVLNLFHSRLQNRRVDVLQQYGEDTWLTCFEGDIRQVLNNLVSNAVDAMPAGGTLTIRTRKVRRWSDGVQGVRVTVADTGIGIAPEQLAEIFTAFYTTKGIGGTGLGLWISCRIVHKHRGFLRAYSSTRSARRGTAIMLWLPVSLADTAGEQWASLR